MVEGWTAFSSYGHHDMLSLIFKRKAVGDLFLIDQEQVLRRLSFDQGRVVFAESEAELERLKAALIARGAISPSQFDQAEAEFSESKTLAANLRDMGLLTQRELLEGVAEQIRRTTVGFLSALEGHMLFRSNLAEAVPIVQLGHPHFEVEAVLALEDRERLAQHLGNVFDRKPRLVEAIAASFCDEIGIPVDLAALANGERSIKQIAFESFLDFFLVLKFFYALDLLGFSQFES